MPQSNYQGNLQGLARLLITENILSEENVLLYLNEAKAENVSFSSFLVKKNLVKEAQLAVFTAQYVGCSFFDLSYYNEDYLPPKFDVKYIAEKKCLPLMIKNNTMFIALGISSAFSLSSLGNELKFHFKSLATNLVFIITEDTKLDSAIHKVVAARDLTLSQNDAQATSLILSSESDLFSAFESEVEFLSHEEEAAPINSGVDDTPVVKYLQKILIDAIKSGVSDIHFEPYEKSYRVRYRRDGVLEEASTPPLAIKDRLSVRIKVMSNINIAEKRVPQDGRFKLKLSPTKAIDFRVSSCPTLFGEKIVMRILDPSAAQVGIDALGYTDQQKKILMDAISRPYGMVLVTGPTGSGKTVSLYTCLNILNKPGINISTAEDPAEITLTGVNQVNVNDAAGLTFSAALKSFLRQDPDIIMVGEIRDVDTAEISIKAAQTGHLVLSTLHTNDAPSTLTRLLNMGIPAFNIASSVILITAQRLSRRLCNACKTPEHISDKLLLNVGFSQEELQDYGKTWKTYKGVGCPECKNSGYKGRVGIYQVMPITEAICEIMIQGGNALNIARQSEKEGVETLRRAGLNKVKEGVTSLEEVESCTNIS